jgi:nucleoside 2-deoxyribosyltransferase
MPRCFVIQPFEQKFTKRFKETYQPAIEACGLEAYRVDYDPSVMVPIEAIEEGIRESAIVLADITLDNPNVWYELGYAFALRRPVVMICSAERESVRYPFDIQHRTISKYQVQSAGDFAELEKTISTRISAILKRADVLEAVASQVDVAPVEGLTQPELAILGAAAGSVVLPTDFISIYPLKSEVERAGFTAVAFSLGIKRLLGKDFIKIEERDGPGAYDDSHAGLILADAAWLWIEANESKFVLTKPSKSADYIFPADDDPIPF